MHLMMIDIFDGESPIESRVLYGKTQEEAEQRFSKACARDPLLHAAASESTYEGQALRIVGRCIEVPDDQAPALAPAGG